ncbi:Photosynthetic NDH subunit of lumenal location 2 [Hibiscus syriacus]|uniref:Photosynthetic NDH subunit of lumenal location 2 n=1 Tax=Hibiscus syriacus TaxID=106335 RepID=A0A6A3CUG3_HIBSY|nr:photosynthetic NDH subunit of lumenal location 2, chloroplastic-like [Hibiscus syriacus]KAE8732940.1 Photosynthetic NDH subunit of lumenal location 2 [Hibiscus syriacus]
MSSFISSTFSTHVNHNFPTPQTHHCSKLPLSVIRASVQPEQNIVIVGNRRKLVTTFVAASLAALGLQGTQVAVAENWGTHSFLRERFFEPGLSPEDAAARIKQTAEGLHSMRDMLDTMSWRYVMFYIRLKQAYLSQDLKNAMNTLPQGRKDVYVKTANELVDNMAEFDYYVRTPKVYESYLYYEKTLKSIDDLVALLG